MQHRSTVFAVVAWIGGSFVAVHAASPCLHADVGIDAAHTAITLHVDLPRGSKGIFLQTLDGYQRSRLWHSPDGSTRITDNSLQIADPRQRQLRMTMDVRSNLERPDRTYAPFLRFSDGTVAVNTAIFSAAANTLPLCLRFVPAAGEQAVGFGTASERPLNAPDLPAPAAYVAFGTPRVERFDALMMVTDRGAPEWIRQRLHASLPGVAGFYRQRMGPMAIPTVFLYRLAGKQPGSAYHGDRLPGSITLGLSDASWQQPDPLAARQLSVFLAHEMFHVWNAGHGLEAVNAEENLASEGGADMASMFAVATIEGQGKRDWLKSASTPLSQCMLSLPDDASALAGHLGNGQLAYDCGVPMMLVIAALNDPRDPVDGYFAAWKRLIDARRSSAHAGYHWSDLLPAGPAGAVVRAALVRAVHGDDAYASSILQALRLAGYVVARQPITDNLRPSLNMRMMAMLMASDCAGRTSFWTHPDGFLLDSPLPECHSLLAGKKVVSLLGQALASDQPEALASAIRARCAAGGKVSVGYADGSTSAMRCPAKPVSAPAPWQIVDYRAR